MGPRCRETPCLQGCAVWNRRGFWLGSFPDATVTRLDDAGHYLQEDAHERIVPELVSFASRVTS